MFKEILHRLIFAVFATILVFVIGVFANIGLSVAQSDCSAHQYFNNK